jgi:hypothetical protein
MRTYSSKFSFPLRSDSRAQSEKIRNVSLLSLTYKIVCPCAIILYIILQLVIGLHYIPLQVHRGAVRDIRVNYVNFGAGSAFTISVIQQIMIICECRKSDCKRYLQGIYFSMMTVSGIAGCSSFLTLILNWGGVLEDCMGVFSNTAQWAEWLITVPMMVYIALAIEDKPFLSKDDKIILIVFKSAIVFGFLLNVDGIPLALGYTIFLLGCCSLTVNIVIEKTRKLAQVLPTNVAPLFASERKKVLFRLFIFVFPLYPFTHILAQLKVLDMGSTMIAYAVISVIAKLLFASYLTTAFVNTADFQEKVNYCHWSYHAIEVVDVFIIFKNQQLITMLI